MPAATGAQITDVLPGQAADRAGLSRDDLLVSVDNFSLATASLEERLKIYPPGAEVPLAVQRHGERQIIMVKLASPVANQYSIEESSPATADQIRLRQDWLGTKVLP
jgi:predicted metalloprotease with PDZ domain